MFDFCRVLSCLGLCAVCCPLFTDPSTFFHFLLQGIWQSVILNSNAIFHNTNIDFLAFYNKFTIYLPQLGWTHTNRSQIATMLEHQINCLSNLIKYTKCLICLTKKTTFRSFFPVLNRTRSQ